MKSEQALITSIFKTALKGCDADVAARRDVLLSAARIIMADALRTTDEFTRERLLHELVPELRGSMDRLSVLLAPPKRNPFHGADESGHAY
jgi:hypothetical protein